MSEFPEWIELQNGVSWKPSYDEAQELHRKLRAVYELVPDIDERMRMRLRPCPWWKRYLWWAVR
jgi:hypothetical protein